MHIELNKDVLYIIDTLKRHGHRADAVGGCVRDFLMGKPPFDIDITTSASPSEMKRIFADERTVETGIKHGTLTVVLHGTPYEVTTYRVDGEYADHRHPDEVIFTETLSEDLARRDFTVNAMCYSPDHGLTDLYGGREDLERGIIRAVGEAAKRFTEDALRILRGLRFSSTLGFEIEEKTAAAMRGCAHLLSFVSAERVLVEWRKLLGGKDARRILTQFSEVLAVAIPALSEIPIEELPPLDDLNAEERMLLLFALLPKEVAAVRFEECALALRSDKASIRRGTEILSHLHDADLGTDESLSYLLHDLGEGGARAALSIRVRLRLCAPSRLLALEKWIEKRPCTALSDLAVDGKALAALGYRGRAIGDALQELLFAVMSGKVENRPDALLSYLGAVK